MKYKYKISVEFTGEVDADDEEEAKDIATEITEDDCSENTLDWYLHNDDAVKVKVKVKEVQE